MRKALLAICALLLSSACATRIGDIFDRSQPSAIERIRLVTSASGVRAWLVEEHSIPVISLRIAWRRGWASDPEGLEGVAEFVAYMMNEGAGDLDSQAFAARMEELHMSFGCSVNADWTDCTLVTLSANSEEAFDLVALALNRTRFDSEPFERARREKLAALEQARSKPGWIAARASNAALRPGHPYARYQTPESVSAVQRKHLLAWRDATLARSGLLIAAAGDIDVPTLKRLMEKLFGQLPPVGAASAIAEVDLKPPPDSPILRPLPRPQTLIAFYSPGPKRSDSDFFPAMVLNYILGGGGFSSRLMDELREKRGLTYGIRTSLSTQLHGGLWTGYTQTRNETVSEVISIIRQEMDRLHKQGPTTQERKDAISYLTGAYPLSFTSNSAIAGQLLGAMKYRLGERYFSYRNDLVRAVTMDDLKRAAAKWLDPDDMAFVLVGQPETGQ